MSRPLSKTAKHRREYVIVCTDPIFRIRKYYTRIGYKSLLLKEFISRFPDLDISIYVLSGSVLSNIK